MGEGVHISGLGFISSIGNNAKQVLESLREHRSGIEFHRFLEPDLSRVRSGGTVKGFSFPSHSWATWTFPEHLEVPRNLLRSLSPHGLYAYYAVEEMLAQSGLSRDALSDGQTGLFCASAGSPFLLHHYLKQMDESGGKRGHPLGVVSSISGTLNFTLGAHYGIRGGNLGFVSACASSSHALAYASEEIRHGRHERMIVVGAEDFTAESILPFAAMRALSFQEGTKASRPFDAARDGFVGTGGAACLLLESEASLSARGGKSLARLAGWGQASDGFDMTNSDPEGTGLTTAMNKAMKDAGWRTAELDYINAHATSTPVGDLSEGKAIRSFLGAAIGRVPVSSTKGLTGHGLSLAGALEAGICTLCLQNQFIPGNANL